MSTVETALSLLSVNKLSNNFPSINISGFTKVERTTRYLVWFLSVIQIHTDIYYSKKVKTILENCSLKKKNSVTGDSVPGHVHVGQVFYH